MLGELTEIQINNLLSSQVIGRIACSSGSRPYIVPVTYVFDGQCIYGQSREGTKLDRLRQNGEVCFEVDNTKNLANWQSVIAWGSFEELPDGNNRNEAIRILRERKLPILSSQTMQLGSQWPFVSEGDKIDGIVFRVYLKEKTGRSERSAEASFFAT